MSSQDFAKRRPVPVLSYNNKDDWFSLMKEWLQGEGLFYTVTATTSPGLRFNLERDDAKARYWLRICIDEDDRERVRELEESRLIWESLKEKYEIKLQVTRRQFLQSFINFQFQEGTTISEAWTQLATLGRKIAVALPEHKSFSSEKARLDQLLQALPQEYMTIRDSVDTQPNLTTLQVLQILKEKEAQLKANDTAMLAKKASKPSRRPHLSEPESDSDRRPLQCHLCDGRHRILDCPQLPAAKETAKKRRSQKARSGAEKQIQELQRQINQLKAFSANEKDDTQDPAATDEESSSCDEEASDEIAALSRTATSKIPREH